MQTFHLCFCSWNRTENHFEFFVCHFSQWFYKLWQMAVTKIWIHNWFFNVTVQTFFHLFWKFKMYDMTRFLCWYLVDEKMNDKINIFEVSFEISYPKLCQMIYLEIPWKSKMITILYIWNFNLFIFKQSEKNFYIFAFYFAWTFKQFKLVPKTANHAFLNNLFTNSWRISN